MEYRLTEAGQCVAATTLFIALGAMIYGCSDTASVNPAAELAGLPAARAFVVRAVARLEQMRQAGVIVREHRKELLHGDRLRL